MSLPPKLGIGGRSAKQLVVAAVSGQNPVIEECYPVRPVVEAGVQTQKMTEQAAA